MRLWRREWLRVGPVIAIAGGLLWLLAEGNIGQAALLRSTVWAVVVWVACGLVWMGLHVCEWDDQGPRQRDSNDRGPEQHAVPCPSSSALSVLDRLSCYHHENWWS